MVEKGIDSAENWHEDNLLFLRKIMESSEDDPKFLQEVLIGNS